VGLFFHALNELEFVLQPIKIQKDGEIMASINKYQLKSGKYRWEVRGYAGYDSGKGINKTYHKAGFRSFDEANRYGKHIENELANDTESGRRGTMKLRDWLNQWITKYKVNVKEGSMIVCRYQVEHYLIPNIGGYTFRQYTPAIHQDFILGLLKHGGKDGAPLSYHSVSIINATLSNAFKKAKQLGYVTTNPTEGVEFPRAVKPEKTKLHYWSVTESDVFLQEAIRERDPVWYVFFLTILDLGLRKGEAMALQWKDVNLSDNSISITKTRLYRAEKGEHKNDIIIDDPKFPASNRTLFMTPRLVQALAAFNRLFYGNTTYVRKGKKAFAGPNDLIFRYSWSEKDRGIPLRDRSTNGAFERIRKRAGLPKIKIHDLRHTHGVMLREAGVPLDDIKNILGHKSIETTEIYAEITPKVVKSANQKYIEYLNNAK
jgi:integrase